MKVVAIPYDNNKVFQHFGHTEKFKIVEIDEYNQLLNHKIIDTEGKGHESLASFLKQNNVDILICGGIGQGAINALKMNNIKIYAGIVGDIDQVLNDFVNNRLVSNENASCSSHHKNHDCFDHHKKHHECSCHH